LPSLALWRSCAAVREHEACLTPIGRHFNPFRHNGIDDHRSPQSNQGDVGSKPALAEFEALLASPPSQLATHEQSPQLLQRFLKWREKGTTKHLNSDRFCRRMSALGPARVENDAYNDMILLCDLPGGSMTRFVVGDDRSQSTLFPERLDDYLDEDNPVRAVDVFVDELDLAGLGFGGVEPEATGEGQPIILRAC